MNVNKNGKRRRHDGDGQFLRRIREKKCSAPIGASTVERMGIHEIKLISRLYSRRFGLSGRSRS
jgi:hypothetical protein